MSTTYLLGISPFIHRHSYGDILVLQDGLEFNRTEFEAQIRSGDYFSLLATQLDDISQAIYETNEPESANIEAIIKKLLYLQANYKLAPQDDK